MPRGATIKLVPLEAEAFPVSLCGAFFKPREDACACSLSECPSKSRGDCRKVSFNIPGVPETATLRPPRSRSSRNACVGLCKPAKRSDGAHVTVTLKPAAGSVLSGPLRYILDSGSAFNIANRDECSDELLAEIINLHPAWVMSTCNGTVTVQDGIRLVVPAL